MKRYTFIVEKTDTGYSAFAADDKVPVVTTGADMPQLRKNILDALNTWLDIKHMKPAVEKELIIRLDLAQFFEYYKVINSSALAERIGISQSLLSQYANGIKNPSDKQVNRILTGIKALGQELTYLELI
ncbi:helix-turn-helix domain-containing protein [Chitinophaga sp. XS-30]|uniref:helix-turn-helix domain-containing protein n=1 Tax=Chitinophaga sp. XS-30 TaxID=2604421 RepID=UPI0011DD5137|nr:helix-turn-helix transcriptional regulator [Chitinophaga sp. XS-30]QEH41557.1 helix-turn-helix transcriptional regulator [Chitinophaga sp. XS-30]